MNELPEERDSDKEAAKTERERDSEQQLLLD